MSRLALLKQATTKRMLAKVLDVNPSFLTKTLYLTSDELKYKSFEIPKRNGDPRTIYAPNKELKDLQSRLSALLLDCIDEINKERKITPKLSHGFVRNRSIITNAKNHTHKKNVLNLDLNDFFGSFNFGRVRGFFIKNQHFELHEHIATVIAQIACYKNFLPQGSPCSPVITNLIMHSVDIRLAKLAKKNSCTYTRYADDITFSTRENIFPKDIAIADKNKIHLGRRLSKEITDNGFTINEKKTRVQLMDSRQDVTGLVVNKKVNIKSDYWRITRAMCHSLFQTGSYIKCEQNGQEVAGTLYELDGRLNFIDYIDKYNNVKEKGPIDNRFSLRNHGLNYREKLNVREKTFSRFLFYKYFFGHNKPTVLCEGKTDNIYIKAAILRLSEKFDLLSNAKTDEKEYELLVNFLEYSKRTRYLLDLYGGASYLKRFVERYRSDYSYYRAPAATQPVIIVADNDSGSTELISYLVNNKPLYPELKKDKVESNKIIKDSSFVHVEKNLYIVFTPLIDGRDSFMENLFSHETLNIEVDGRKFSPQQEADTKNSYGKNNFATKVVSAKKHSIPFSGFEPLLTRMEEAIIHYRTQIEKNKVK
ncbi:retron Ec67 family RNA-directed DNA polymerase/endonuclease [Aeromonas caviae]|uniref:retron Ec67 family RNA-directed DNA polymerase/endonuclease n=1 Tax=Aeromonas caviae TaxID=648 RepID=UPI002DBDA15C|nr:retron Ec67 family RNA-directed DNA polymerase/endonuclease [Aeromonas caviae]